ncbi:alpha/beta fold hydrolase [Rhodopseudomonas rhenobacensis]
MRAGRSRRREGGDHRDQQSDCRKTKATTKRTKLNHTRCPHQHPQFHPANRAGQRGRLMHFGMWRDQDPRANHFVTVRPLTPLSCATRTTNRVNQGLRRWREIAMFQRVRASSRHYAKGIAMPFATTKDHVQLYYEEAGDGTPILFLHEFAGDYASWEPQMRYFSRGHRCITYSARGYTPSHVPDSDADYDFQHVRDDAIAMLDQLRIAAAHFVGLSMGAYSALQVALQVPSRVLSLTLAGIGSGFEAERLEAYRARCRAEADEFERGGASEITKLAGLTPGRIPFLVKDPRGFRDFHDALGEHDANGSARTMRNFQGARPPLSEFKEAIAKLTLPTLIMVGDEDDACIDASLFLKQQIATSGLAMFPRSGHVLNLEEPALFNAALEKFLALAEAGRWGPRDPRSVRA